MSQQLTQQQQIALERLDIITRDLRSRQDDVRRKAAGNLRDLVAVCHRDLTAEHFHLFFTGVNNRITQLITHGNDSSERLGGIYALDALIDFDGADAAQKYTRFTQNLKTILRGKDINTMQAAAIALGKLCRPGGTLTSDLVEAEVKTALEWLQSERVEERRYSAVLTLRELARNAPTLMYAYVGLIFDLVWVGLRDTRQLIRATAAETVSACFRIIRERDQELKQTWMTKMYNETNQGLKVSTIESIHGSLLVLKELLEQGGMYMQEHYDEACEIVFKHKDHRDPTIRKTVILLIPDLASYSPADFANRYLHKFMLYLSGMLKKDKERNDAFLAIGNVANSVKSAIAPYLDGVLIYVREGLSIASRKRGSVDPVFDCISRLAVAVGQTLSKYMEALLDPIFACELTPKLTQALVDMAFYIPPVKSTIQDRLLDMLSVVLCGEAFKPLGAPQPNTLTSVPIVARDAKDPQAYEHRKAEIKLALNTLGSFDFSGIDEQFLHSHLSASAEWRLKCIAESRPSTAPTPVRSHSLDTPMEERRFNISVPGSLLKRRQGSSSNAASLAPLKRILSFSSFTPALPTPSIKTHYNQGGPHSLEKSDRSFLLTLKGLRSPTLGLKTPLSPFRPGSPGHVGSLSTVPAPNWRRPSTSSSSRSSVSTSSFRLLKWQVSESPQISTGTRDEYEKAELITYGKGHVLNEFVRDVAVKYVEDEDPEIREAAALTCCQLYVRDPIVNQTSYHALQVVGDVIEKLLTVGVSDPDPKIRRTVLAALDERFDRHLAKAENIRVLFFALNDEVFAIREVAISIIGRLARFNPAYVVPSLRKSLIQMLTELEFSDVARNKEESAKLLSLLIQNAQGLIKPYVTPMISVLLPKANDPTPSVAATILNAIGELATVGGEDMLPYKDDLMPLIIAALQDQSSNAKREAALHALGQLASNSGYVITPYIEYPQLLELLQQIIRSENQRGPLRQETIKLMGILGALDPYKHQQVEERTPEIQRRVESNQMTDISLMMTGLTPSNKEYFPTVVINALLQILKDPSLVQHHAAVIEAIMNIFRTLGLECVSFLDRIVPAFLQVIRSSPTPRLESYFNQLATLVTIVRQHIRNYLPAIVEILREYWSTSASLQTTILHLVEAISQSLEGEFKVYLAGLLPLMLGALERDVSTRRTPSERVLHAFLVFGSSSEEYMHLIIPVIVRTFEKQGQPIYIRKLAIETIGKISLEVNLNDFAARIIHPLTRVLAGTESSLRMAALDTLCFLIQQLGKDYLPFMGNVNKIMAAHGIQHSNYELLVSKLQKGEGLPQHLTSQPRPSDLVDEPTFGDLGTKKLEMNPVHLKAAWDTKGKSTKEDWQEWLRRFSTTLLTESPNHALRACASLASVYLPLARELFNSAFVSCWSELYEQFQDELIQNIESAIKSENVPPDLLGLLLNLAEFMEHDDKALPIDIRVLGREAARCHAYAKALHYKELEFLQDQSSPAVEALIVINNQLQQSDAAIGILRKAQLYKDGITLRETWFEKLERWEEALAFYNKRIEEAAERDEKPKVDVLMGRMRCLHALGEWDTLASIANDTFAQAPPDLQRLIAPLATAAAWGLGKWDSMDTYLQSMRRYTPDRSFFSAILALHRNQFREALNHVQQAREGLDTELSALISESYNRAYQVVVRVQMLAELEELIVYKQCDEKRQATMRRTWEARLKGCQRNVEVWLRMLRLRALVITPAENMHMWIKFANLCRKSGRILLAEKSLKQLVGIEGSLDEVLPYWGDRQQPLHGRNIPAQVVYAVLKFMWEKGLESGTGKNKDPDRLAVKSLHCLRKFTHDSAARLEGIKNQLAAQVPTGFEISSDFNFQHPLDPAVLSPQTHKALQEQTVLLAKCYLRQGEWLKATHQEDWKQRHVEDVLSAYSCATKYNPNWYRAWHGWALANFEIINDIMNRAMNQGVDLSPAEQAIVIEHVVPAVRGFFKSIALSVGSSLQDTLRLLTLWFAHGGNAEVNTAVTEGFTNVSVDTWLEVIPQLIARINQPNRRVQSSVHSLLSDVGRAHPQALVYPLTVAMKSWTNTRRSRSAAQIMESMRQHSHILVAQADIVSHELIRVAVLWHELWHEGLEEASRLYFGDHNIEGMFAALGPLHEMLERGPETLREISFAQAFGRDLSEAREWCRQYETSRDVNDLNQAWDLYYQVFRRISRQLPQMTTLELTYCSPKLLAAKDLDLAVPGTYRSGQPIVRIKSFDSTFSVINSKQRPRKLSVSGSDGTSYTFLLKGHEDIRQDERVMQLFGLCNTLLAHDTECYKRHLGIQRYPAIPLSQNSGLLGWVPNSDTLHVLIREYRESRKILLNIEHRIMLQMAPDYDNLTLMQKVEVFGYALDNTTGQDLYRVLWLKSKSSEAWLERRTNYTRSLGVMSMVGYILGLGDRHPSNLMLDRITGKIIHIDFGDCFEVAMKREKYPERVPFRLTRMLTYAMEVSNIEGSFRITSEHVMRVLRDNKESVMAVLEAFIHDPLLTWRLTNTQSPPGPFQSERENAIGGAQGGRGRRPSIMDHNPQDLLAAMDGTTISGAPPPSSRARARTNSSAHPDSSVLNGNVPQQPMDPAEAQNARAVEVLARVSQKLTGKDFKTSEPLDVLAQVDKLIIEATKFENLCQHYIGWCSFW